MLFQQNKTQTKQKLVSNATNPVVLTESKTACFKFPTIVIFENENKA